MKSKFRKLPVKTMMALLLSAYGSSTPFTSTFDYSQVKQQEFIFAFAGS